MESVLARLVTLLVVGALCGVGLPSAPQEKPQAKPAETAPASKPAKTDADGKNPMKATPESLAAAKKIFGFDCAMCHGAAGDGKGDLAGSMGLKMNDWREGSHFSALTDAEIYDLIVKGKGKMIGEGDRYSAETVWGLVSYVRTFEKKEAAAVPKPGAPQ